MHWTKFFRFLCWLSLLSLPVSVSLELGFGRGYRFLAGCLKLKGTRSSQVLVTRDSKEAEYDLLNDQTDSPLPFTRPIAYIVVDNVADVSNSIICARKLKIHTVIRAGGHSYGKYSFGDNSTVIIDLRNLNQVTVHKSNKTATVGPGVLLAQLYWDIWNQGRFGVPGGYCLAVGMGQPLGGGQGCFQKMFGLLLDNVIEFEIVDVNGQLRIVNQEKNKDLFWALRGAGAGSFGIVTSFKFQLFDAKDVKFRRIRFNYRVSDFQDVFRAWDIWNKDTTLNTVFSDIAVTSGKLTLLITDFDYNLRDNDIERLRRTFPPTTIGEPILKSDNFIDFIAFHPFSNVNITDVSQLAGLKREATKKNTFVVKSYFVDKTLKDREIKELAEIITQMPPGVLWATESYGGAVNRIKSNASAFLHRNSLYNIEFKVTSNEKNVRNYVREFDDFILRNMDNGHSYQNYADWQLKDYLFRYYGENLQRLVKIKRKVDPQDFFNFPQSIPTYL